MAFIYEHEIVNAFREGDSEAFEIIEKKYRAEILDFIFKLISNKSESEKFTAKLFDALKAKHKAFNSMVNIKAYLYINARNMSGRYLKIY